MSHAIDTAVRTDVIERLIEQFASLTEPGTGAGVTRLAYTPLEREAHACFADWMRRLGLDVQVDAAGNTVAELPGTDPTGLPALGTGSHLDSVPGAGRFDGIAGVVAAMVAARALVEVGPLRHAVRFVVFAGEEGARFGQACTGSRLVGGLTTPADLEWLVDKDRVSVATAMRALGLDPTRAGDAAWHSRQWSAWVELHVEQGSTLADAGLPIGIVDVISGSTRVKIKLDGCASHTGGTPMHRRVDALAAAAEIVLAGEHQARDARHHGTRITVGKLDVQPGSITTIPGHCELYVDVRDIDSERQRTATNELINTAHDLAAARGVRIETSLLGDASPVVLSAAVRSTLVATAETAGLGYRVMPSGASHDTQMIAHLVPAGMIFVPSRNGGVSHTPDEFTDFADLAVGARLLVAALLRFDALDAGPDEDRS